MGHRHIELSIAIDRIRQSMRLTERTVILQVKQVPIDGRDEWRIVITAPDETVRTRLEEKLAANANPQITCINSWAPARDRQIVINSAQPTQG